MMHLFFIILPLCFTGFFCSRLALFWCVCFAALNDRRTDVHLWAAHNTTSSPYAEQKALLETFRAVVVEK